MTGGTGRILVGGKDCGAGFALGPRLVVTAGHVVRRRKDQPVAFLPAGGEAIAAARVQEDADHDAAVLELASDACEFLTVSAPARGAAWRVASPPTGGNDPELHGTVSSARMAITNAQGHQVEVAQLAADENLGDYAGYSGSAVLDPLRPAVLALLVEQKPLRTAVTPELGQRPPASNVLYAVPIGDVIAACGLPVRPGKPLRFSVGSLPGAVTTRPVLLDRAVDRIIQAAGARGGALVLLRGPGGAGKTVLARQVAVDPRIWAAFADGIVMLRAGQQATGDSLTGELKELLGHQDRDLADALGAQRLLLIVDDVWAEEPLTTLRASLPGTVAVLATTRGVFVRGGAVVEVGAVSLDQAIEILAGDTPRSPELDQVLGDLAGTLFCWPLLLTLATAQIHLDAELDPAYGDEDEGQPQPPDPGEVVRQARELQENFQRDPTTLDDLARAHDSAPPRSVDFMIRRSFELRPDDLPERFRQLAVFPRGAVISQPMLEDLWELPPSRAAQEIRLLVQAGLAQRVGRSPLSVELHDLIAVWLYHDCGQPGDVRHQAAHQRLAGLCQRADGGPGEVTRDRAQWLAYHLVHGGSWDRLRAVPTIRWRSAFLIATGSDAAFLAGLDFYGQAAVDGPESFYHAVRPWLFAAHVRRLIGTLPVSALVSMAVAADPAAAVIQACQHPEAGQAVSEILDAVADRVDRRFLQRTLDVAATIPDDDKRDSALARIAWRMAALGPQDPEATDQAAAVADAIRSVMQRDAVLAGIVGGLAGAGPLNPELADRALALVATMSPGPQRDETLKGIAWRVADTDPGDPGVTDQALTAAGTISSGYRQAEALAGIARRLAATDPARSSALTDQALDVAGSLPNEERDEALARIAGQLAGASSDNPGLTDRAVTAARAIADASFGSRTLASVARRLAATDPVRSGALFDEALDAAEALPAQQRDETLAGIAGELADAGPRDPALAGRAATVAGAIADPWLRGEMLGTVASRMMNADPLDQALIEQALTVAAAIPDDRERHRATASAARRLAGRPRDPSLVNRAVDLAATIPYDRMRSETLAGIAEQLAAADPPDPALTERALAVAEAIPLPSQRSKAQAGIARRLAAVDPERATALINQAVSTAGTIADGLRSPALADIARQLAAVDPERATALINQAVTTAVHIPIDGGQLFQALAGLAEQLAAVAPRDLALTERALTVAERIPHAGERAATFAAIAVRLAAADPRDGTLTGRAEVVAGTMPDAEGRNAALTAIARQLAAADPGDRTLAGRALTVASTISDAGQHATALAAIAMELADADPPLSDVLVNRALNEAGTITATERRGPVLAAILQQLAGLDPGRLETLAEQLPAAFASIGDLNQGLPPAVADYLSAGAPRDVAPLDEAMTMAFPDPGQRGKSLSMLASYLMSGYPTDPGMTDCAVTIANLIPDELARGDALVAIARQLAAADPRDAGQTGRAVSVARAIPDTYRRQSDALKLIAEELATAGPRDQTLVNQALDVVSIIPDHYRRSDALAFIAEGLAAADPLDQALITQAESIAGSIEDDPQRYDALARIGIMARGTILDELSRWRLRPLSHSINLLTVFLRYCPDAAAAEGIGRAVCDVAAEFP